MYFLLSLAQPAGWVLYGTAVGCSLSSAREQLEPTEAGEQSWFPVGLAAAIP